MCSINGMCNVNDMKCEQSWDVKGMRGEKGI